MEILTFSENVSRSCDSVTFYLPIDDGGECRSYICRKGIVIDTHFYHVIIRML